MRASGRSACGEAMSCAGTKGNVSVSRLLVRRSLLTIGASLFARVRPAGCIPEQDQGIFGANVQIPPRASLERTSVVLKKIEDMLAKTAGLDSFQSGGDCGAVTSTYQPNDGMIFLLIKSWDERKTAALQVNGITGALRPRFAAIPGVADGRLAYEQGGPAVHGAPSDWRREPVQAPSKVR
jgi:multidrug efflux pump subunit AcrB